MLYKGTSFLFSMHSRLGSHSLRCSGAIPLFATKLLVCENNLNVILLIILLGLRDPSSSSHPSWGRHPLSALRTASASCLINGIRKGLTARYSGEGEFSPFPWVVRQQLQALGWIWGRQASSGLGFGLHCRWPLSQPHLMMSANLANLAHYISCMPEYWVSIVVIIKMTHQFSPRPLSIDKRTTIWNRPF